MTSGHPTQQHATEDSDNSSINTSSPRKRDKLRNVFRFKSEGLNNKAPNQSLDAQVSPPPAARLPPVTSKTKDNECRPTTSSSPTYNLLPTPPTKTKLISGIFPKNLAKPVIKSELPGQQDRIEVTQQLVYCSRLIRDSLSPVRLVNADEGSTGEFVGGPQHPSPTASQKSVADDPEVWKPNEAERTWIELVGDDLIKQDELRWLVAKVVDEFANDLLKGHDLIAEVALVGPVLDRDTYRSLLSCFINKFEHDSLLDVPLLQGLVQLVEGASPGYLVDDDLVKILAVLRRRLQGTHKPSSEHMYQITIAVSRLLDVMVNGEVSGVNRVEQHQPLIATLRELRDTKDPILGFQVEYALQASQYIPNDESVWQAVLRFGGGITMAALGVATVGKMDPVKLFESLDALREGAFQAAGHLYEISESMLKGADSLQKGSFGAMQSLRLKFREDTDYEWYLTLLAARNFVRDGRLADFNQTVCEARCRDKRAFQLGVCQILGEITMDPLWDPFTRQNAVKFLGVLGKTATGWKQHPEVKQSIVVILTQISQFSDVDVKDPAHSVLQDMQQDYTATTSIPAANFISLKNRLPLPDSSPLLNRAQEIQELEFCINRLKTQRLKEGHQPVYIPPMAKANLQAPDDALFCLMEKVQDFLASEQQVMLILGDSGAGKSTFNRHLEYQLWSGYKKGDTIPLHINLPAIDRPDVDIIAKQLQMLNFKEDQILEMKQHRQFILICDGYDESQQLNNLYRTNRLNQAYEWQAKMIISCRSEFLGSEYLNRFTPGTTDHYKTARMDLFQEAVIAPFSEKQIEEYVSCYVSLEPRPLVTEEYMQRLTTIPSLMDLVKNPFLLTLTLEALPGVTKSQQSLSTIRITRVELYDHFVEQWLDASMRRLQKNALSKEDMATLELVDAGIVSLLIDYSTKLAQDIFDQQDGYPVVKFAQFNDGNTWKARFFGQQPDVRLLREASPLKRAGNQFQFVHQSMLEYFFSRVIYSPVRLNEKEFDLEGNTAAPTSLLFDRSSPLFRRNLLKEPSIIQFLCDRVNLHPEFKQQLRAVIDQSKADPSATIAATNAITILVKAGVNFNGADLRNVKIPGTDLSGSQFDSCQFQGADLRNVNFAGSWLRQANLSGALMKGVRFGELPYLKPDGSVKCCTYSPDGKLLAMGLDGGGVGIYDTSCWKRVGQFEPGSYGIHAVAFSPDGARIVSGDYGGKLQLWDCSNGNKVMVMTGHTKRVTSVAFSTCGNQVASASEDKTVRLWDSQTGEVLFVLEGHAGWVMSVKFSPKSRELASGSDDGTIRFWDPKTGEPGVVLSCSLGEVHSLAYSPGGQWIASGHKNGGLQLWNAASHESGPILQGHKNTVTGIEFSANDQLIASSSQGKTVRLWDASTGVFITKLKGHRDIVYDVAFSPDGSQLASASKDEMVRLWEVNSKSSNSGQKDRIVQAWKAAYSSDGQYIISTDGSAVQQRDATTGTPGLASLEFPTSLSVSSVEFSSDGERIMTRSRDGSVQVLDHRTGKAGPILKTGSDMVKFADVQEVE
ncbi:hypothetical protein BGZ97_008543 [Linnemannia gamsii]|uniref:WD40 repeat-like protein n=1 Tax=Linnemannia gamsii TaxID=64522 RepID=A0A9P6RB62_9FUNG|nr:hypothetical protein BGZ97_008543 [Linnemannia gamsii]